MKYLRIFESERIRQQVLAQIDYGVLSSAEGVIRLNKVSGSGPAPQGNDHYIGVIVNDSGETQNFTIMNWQDECGAVTGWEPLRIKLDGVDMGEISHKISLGPGEHTIEIWDNPENEGYYSMSYEFNGSNPGYFANCSYDSMIIPDYVTSICSNAFSGCTDLTSITIPNSVTSIGDQAFSSCTGLTSITIPNSVTSIGSGAFYNCAGLTSVTIPNSVTSIDNDTFSGCTGLTSVTIPNSVTSIGGVAFSGCSHLTSITIPNSVTSIGGGAFYSCGLTSITIPNSVTSIGSGAFQYCTGLTSVAIPNSVTSIDSYAFNGCNDLVSVRCEGTNPPTIGEGAFESTDENLRIFVPDGSVNAYKTAWSKYAGRIVSANEE